MCSRAIRRNPRLRDIATRRTSGLLQSIANAIASIIRELSVPRRCFIDMRTGITQKFELMCIS